MRPLVLFLCCFAFQMVRAQDIIIPKDGNPITAFNIDSSDTYMYYQLSETDTTFYRIQKSEVVFVRYSTDKSESYNVIPESELKGNLLAKGNCVFIPTDGQNWFEKEAQLHIKKKIEEEGYWKVVSSPDESHFVLQFVTNLEGRDSSWLLFRNREKYLNNKLSFSDDDVPVCKGVLSGESKEENIKAANILLERLSLLIAKIDGKDPNKWIANGVGPMGKTISSLKSSFVK